MLDARSLSDERMQPLTTPLWPSRVPFGFAAEGRGLSAALEPVRQAIAGDPALQPSGAPGEQVRADVRAAPRPDGTWRIERLYWSVQRPDRGAPGGLRARMLVVDRKRSGPEPTVHDFPDDPRLPAAGRPAGPLVAGHGGGAVEVLRYIPLGRITFRTMHPGRSLIGKIKAPRSLERAEARLAAVRAASDGASFAVAEPLGIDAEHGVMFQSACPGFPLPEAARGAATEVALRRFGEVHREIHALEVDAPPADEAALRDDLRADATWIADALPAHAPAVARLRDWLEAHLRWSAPAEHVFCHGDYSPAQILCDGERWAVVDFDDAHRGDRYAEVAAVLVSIEYETDACDAATLQRRREAYLAGYGTPFEAERLLAHEAGARVGLLARRLRKDRAAPGEPASVLATLLEQTGA
jgi:aminoglycoside phosphotransferase (APT) family kinase protein